MSVLHCKMEINTKVCANVENGQRKEINFKLKIKYS